MLDETILVDEKRSFTNDYIMSYTLNVYETTVRDVTTNYPMQLMTDARGMIPDDVRSMHSIE